jgi:hypothetical protein
VATATISIDAGVAGVMTRAKTITGPNLTRFIAAVRKAYGVNPGFSDIQALEIWADFVFDQAKATTLGQEQASAAAAVVSIDLT